MKLVKKISLLIFILLLSVGSSKVFNQGSGALNTSNVNTAILITFDFEQISIDSTAGGKGFTTSKINPTVTAGIPIRTRAQRADCLNETAQIRISTNSATTVSSTVGTLVDVGQSFTIFGYDDISTFKGIRVTSTSAQIDCHYSRQR